MAYMDLGLVEDLLLLFKMKCSVSIYMNTWSCIYKTIIFMFINLLLLCYFFSIQMVTFKWKSPVFSGKVKKFCLAITSILKPWWQSNMHWVNANCIRYGTKPLGPGGWVSICPGWLSLQAHILLLYFWPLLFALRFVCCPLSAFSFSCLAFPVFLLCLSFGCQSVPQFSKLRIIYRRCSEFLDPCSVPRPDLYNIFVNDLEEVTDSSSLQMTPDWGHQSIHSRAELPDR